MELWHAMRNLTSFSSLNFCTKAQWAQYYRRPKWEFPFAHHWVYVKGVPCRLYYSIYFWKEYVKTLHAHHSFISICGKPICKIQFADDIDPMAGTDSKLQDLTDTLQMHMERRSSLRRACYDHQQRQSRDWNERSTAERDDQLFIFQSHLFSKMGAAQQKSASGSIQQQQLDSIWWSRTIKFSIKYRPYKSLVAPIMH